MNKIKVKCQNKHTYDLYILGDEVKHIYKHNTGNYLSVERMSAFRYKKLPHGEPLLIVKEDSRYGVFTPSIPMGATLQGVYDTYEGGATLDDMKFIELMG